jgi:hypothetical protein
MNGEDDAHAKRSSGFHIAEDVSTAKLNYGSMNYTAKVDYGSPSYTAKVDYGSPS